MSERLKVRKRLTSFPLGMFESDVNGIINELQRLKEQYEKEGYSELFFIQDYLHMLYS
jgi:hypothetical protein